MFSPKKYRTYRYACDTGCLEYGLVAKPCWYISGETSTYSSSLSTRGLCIYHALILPASTLMFHYLSGSDTCAEFSNCGTTCSVSPTFFDFSKYTFTKACITKTACDMTIPANGNITLIEAYGSAYSVNFYDLVTFACNPGYGLWPSTNPVTCLSSGAWNSLKPSCLADCGSLTLTLGTVTISPNTLEGAIATHRCNAGYALSGGPTRNCQSNGTWSGSPVSCLIDCRPLTSPANGLVTTYPDTLQGSTATYICNSGYGMVGTSTRTCLASGSWSSSQPTCLIDCGSPPTIEDGTVSTSPHTYYNATATYSCNTGFGLVGDPSSTCLASGSWNSTSPTCFKECGVPGAPTNGFVLTSPNTLEGSTAMYSCVDSYVLIGEATRYCLSTGLWNGTEPTCVRDCGEPPAPTNGAVITFPDTLVAANAIYTCDSGYGLVGNSTRTCQLSGTWSNSEPLCLTDCGDPDTIGNGTVSTFPHTYFNAIAAYTCATGFGLVGNETSICLESGIWNSGAPSCVLDCGALLSPSNGKVTTSPNTLVNGTAVYSCNPGYVLVGNGIIVCLDSGSWNDTLPICVTDCFTPSPPVNGNVVVWPNTALNATATYSCNAGYSLIGMAVRFCIDTGQWDPEEPECIVDCGTPSAPVMGYVDITGGTVVNSTAIYTCQDGTTLFGETNQTCSLSGQWSGSPPVCLFSSINSNSSGEIEKIYIRSCLCVNNYSFAGKTQDEILDILVQETQIDTKKTTLALSKTNCMEDDRPSAAVVGTVGIVFFALIFGGLALLDLITFCQFISTVLENNKNAV